MVQKQTRRKTVRRKTVRRKTVCRKTVCRKTVRRKKLTRRRKLKHGNRRIYKGGICFTDKCREREEIERVEKEKKNNYDKCVKSQIHDIEFENTNGTGYDDLDLSEVAQRASEICETKIYS